MKAMCENTHTTVPAFYKNAKFSCVSAAIKLGYQTDDAQQFIHDFGGIKRTFF